uniref:ANK_REP_REGION domain-containing protein n=2 Tax=Macrostomum lignano TaxID=282301 RepID=A0A1I8G918_9PLAT
DCKARLDVYDRLNNTPLHRACLEDSFHHVLELIDYCSEQILNHRGYEGKTALHVAVLNQNRRIIRLLLTRGSFVDVPASNGKTAIDLIMGANNVVLMSDLAHFYTDQMSAAVTATSFKELLDAPQFLQYLGFLDAVDNEFQVCSVPYIDLGEEEEKQLLKKVVKDENMDLIEFKEILMKLLQTEVFHVLCDEQNDSLLRRMAANVVRYVLFREDAVMLKKLVACGLVWNRIEVLIENKLEALYLHTPDRGFAGMLTHFYRHFASEHKVQWGHLARHYGQRCSAFGMQADRGGLNQDVAFLRHPMHTLVIWSILAGRSKLTEILLQRERFDVLPMSLFCAALLRTFKDNPSVNVDPDSLEEKALACEKFAVNIAETVFEVDTSYDKCVTTDFLLYPLPTYGNVSCMDLAAKNSSALFLQSPPCQIALEKKWYGTLYDANAIIREIIIWLGVIPLNPIIPWYLMRQERILKIMDERHRSPTKKSSCDSAESQDCSFLLTDSPSAKDAIVAETDPDESVDADGENSKGANESASKEDKKKQDSSGEQQHPADGVKKSPSTAGAGAVARQECFLYRWALHLYDFYHIPAVKFRYHATSHVIMVLLMSYILLYNWEYSIDMIECIMYSIVFGYLIEEIGEFVSIVREENVRNFFASKWNIIDIGAVLCAMISFSIRLTRLDYVMDTKEEHFWMDFDDTVWYIARVFLSVSCLLYWVRLLYISTVMETLGPKLKMIARMTSKDMIPFLFILFIFIFGFGVLIHALLFPNGFKAYNPEQMSSIDVVLAMFKICFYSMVGDYSLDTIMGDDSCDAIYENKTFNSNGCPHNTGRYLVPYFVLPLYVIVTEILLLNLIIALFSKTVDEIDSNSKALWQFERNDLIEEFRGRTSLPPPLNVIPLATRLLLHVVRRLCPTALLRFQRAAQFNQKLILQFLLFQAVSLRNQRQHMMEQCCGLADDQSEQLCQRIQDIVETELLKSKKSNEHQPSSSAKPSSTKPRTDAEAGEKEGTIDAISASIMNAEPQKKRRDSQLSAVSQEPEQKD